MEMQYHEASNGKPSWVDDGAQYDNMTIDCIITAEGADRASLEAIIREQYTTASSIPVTFENDELLFNFTTTVTIQSYEIIEKISDWVEYGYKVKLAIAEYVDKLALAGTRSTTCGNLTYSTANIDQPVMFKQKHHTNKYTGLTHGSSYSAEHPTNTFDSTEWKSTAVAESMRQMWDAVFTDRGGAFYLTFPANSYPFGVHFGSAEKQIVAITGQKKYTFKRVNGHIWALDLIVYSLATPPTFTIQPETQYVLEGNTATFTYAHTGDSAQAYKREPLGAWELLAGETTSPLVRDNIGVEGTTYFEAPPFAGSVGSPVSSDPNWTQDITGVTPQFYGDYCEIGGYTDSTTNSLILIHLGKISMLRSCLTAPTVAASSGIVYIASGLEENYAAGGSLFFFDYDFPTGTIRLRARDKNQGSTVYTDSAPYTIASGDTICGVITVSGGDMSAAYTVTNSIGELQTSGALSILACYDPLVDYDIRLSNRSALTCTWDDFRVEGVGFPETQTAGDPFETEYKITATNAVGPTDSDIVQVLETLPSEAFSIPQGQTTTIPNVATYFQVGNKIRLEATVPHNGISISSGGEQEILGAFGETYAENPSMWLAFISQTLGNTFQRISGIPQDSPIRPEYASQGTMMETTYSAEGYYTAGGDISGTLSTTTKRVSDGATLDTLSGSIVYPVVAFDVSLSADQAAWTIGDGTATITLLERA
jgi:hypothetical protein